MKNSRLKGLQAALLERCVCRECGEGPVELREDEHRRVGLVTFPYLLCVNCSGKTPIKYANVGVCSCKQVCWWNPS